MKVSVLKNQAVAADIPYLRKLLYTRGHDVTLVLDVTATDDFKQSVEFTSANSDAVIVIGFTEEFFGFARDKYLFDDRQRLFIFGDKYYALMDEYRESFLTEEIVPVLNGKSKTFYSATCFKTYGLTEKELRKILEKLIKSKSRIAFSFVEDFPECTVYVRYSNKINASVIEDVCKQTAELLGEHCYATTDISLATVVSELLKAGNKRLKLAESFTGGNIAATLVAEAGASEFLKEGIVCYSNQSKSERLYVDGNLMNVYGAVSIETAYEMAAGLFSGDGCDIAVATTGNAGPTAEREGDVGLCFIAVGDVNGIHIYKERFSGDRQSVIRQGVLSALFRLYKMLSEEASASDANDDTKNN